MRDFLHFFKTGNRVRVSLPVRLPMPKNCPFWAVWLRPPSRDDSAEFRDALLPFVCTTLTAIDGKPHNFVLNENGKRRGGSPIARKKALGAKDTKGTR